MQRCLTDGCQVQYEAPAVHEHRPPPCLAVFMRLEQDARRLRCRCIQKLQVMVRAIRVRGVREERGVPIKGRTGKGAVRVRGLPPAITLTAPAPAAPPYPYSPALEITYGCVRVRVHPHKGKGGPLTRRSPCLSIYPYWPFHFMDPHSLLECLTSIPNYQV